MDAAFRTNTTKNDVNSVASPPETTERRPGDVAASPGVFSHTEPKNAKPLLRPRASKHLLRPDYHKKTLITYAEAADEAGTTTKNVMMWIWNGWLTPCCRVGPYRIDHSEFKEFLRNGYPKKKRRKKKKGEEECLQLSPSSPSPSCPSSEPPPSPPA